MRVRGEERLSLRKLWVLFLNAFLDMLGYAMVFPLLPIYAVRLDADAALIGLMVASFSVAQVAASPLWGRMSDRLGRRPALLVSLFGSALAFFIFAYADSIGMLFLCRIVQGASGGTTGVMQAYVGDSVPPQDRAKALGWLSAATNSGVMIGPALGSAVWVFGARIPGLLAASLCLLNLVFAFFLLPESRTTDGDAGTGRRRPIRAMFWETVRHPGRETSELIVIYAVAMTAFSSMTAVLALYLMHRFAIDESNIGYIFPLLGAVSVFMRAGVLGSLVMRFGEVRLMRAGALLLAVGLFCLPLPNNVALFVPVMLLMPIGTALLFPATSALLSQRCQKSELGQVMGVQQAFGGLARIFGPIWAGAAFGRFGPGVPFEVAGVVVFLVSLLAARVRPESREYGVVTVPPASETGEG
ncbi:MAG TPA: MFS transporter [Vicinamibacteria bacterium]|nr:MFS transporter [Vicinamibacteria bacterium]